MSNADTPAFPARQLPARALPVPASVSPEMQKVIAAPLNPSWNKVATSNEEWKVQIAAAAAEGAAKLPGLRAALKVKSEPAIIDGVKVFILTPETIAPRNTHRLLVHAHGGCYAGNPGEAGTAEGLFMAGFGHIKVISVDYRTPPDFPYPAALDDVVTAWKAALKMQPARNLGVFGASAGGALTLSMVLRCKREGLPLPGAIAPGTPMSDLTNSGDSFETNFMIDATLVGKNSSCDARAALYTNGHDIRDPMLSPLFGDMSGFPPTILTTGTRDLLLSNTVRVHRKLRQAGVEAVLQVFEGQSHGNYYRDVNAPESREAFEEMARFFDLHLGA